MISKRISLKLVAALFAVSLLSLSSCKKDDEPAAEEPAPVPPTKTELITGKNWKLTACTSDPAVPIGGTVVTNVYAQNSNCDNDDIHLFKTNGTYVWDEGPTKCNAGDPQIVKQGNWTFNSTESTITFDAGTANSEDFTLLQLDENTLKGTSIYNDGTLNYVWTYTYTKQ